MPRRRLGALESRFDVAFAARLSLREKQVQQSYRPIIGVHKWFARRPGTLFRALLLAELADAPLARAFWRPQALTGVIGDPFMGGGTPVYEACRVGLSVVGCDINPMAHWIVGQSLAPFDEGAFRAAAAAVVADVDREVGALYRTRCTSCGDDVPLKYVLWVKRAPCGRCGEVHDLFPGHRLAEAVRHPRHVLVCAACGALGEHDAVPTRARPARCGACGAAVAVEGRVQRRRLDCGACGASTALGPFERPLAERPWAVEYQCPRCYPGLVGRQFKRPDEADLARVAEAEARLAGAHLPLPADDVIPPGDETDRLHRWGYRRYRELFGPRQLLGLGHLLARIQRVEDAPVRHALLTVFSDALRYQNRLCRYDTYALKCQDVFSVHGFPVGLLSCENSLLGIEGVGSGSFRHFVEKYARAKAYGRAPFETRGDGAKKRAVPMPGERIEAVRVESLPDPRRGPRQALLVRGPSQDAPLVATSLDGVFTDPPYFDNVQYAELIDFCYAWLRGPLGGENAAFAAPTTRADAELTGNASLGRGLPEFTGGMSTVFQRFASALKPGAPFVFTYHHNEARAYLPLVVAMLDAGLVCTAALPAVGEMSASLHIAGTTSSIVDTVFVCRRAVDAPAAHARSAVEALRADVSALRRAGVRVGEGERRCLRAGHRAREAVWAMSSSWDAAAPLEARMARALEALGQAEVGRTDAAKRSRARPGPRAAR